MNVYKIYEIGYKTGAAVKRRAAFFKRKNHAVMAWFKKFAYVERRALYASSNASLMPIALMRSQACLTRWGR